MVVGVDLVKDPAVLNAAYNDAAGVTAKFNLNLLRRINRELGGNFKLDSFEHHAFYNREKNRIEMHLASKKRQKVKVGRIELRLPRRRNHPYREQLQIQPRVLQRAGARRGLDHGAGLDRREPEFRGLRADVAADSVAPEPQPGLREIGRVAEARRGRSGRTQAVRVSQPPGLHASLREFSIMKIVGFEQDKHLHLGVVEGDQVIDLQAVDPKIPADLGEVLARSRRRPQGRSPMPRNPRPLPPAVRSPASNTRCRSQHPARSSASA